MARVLLALILFISPVVGGCAQETPGGYDILFDGPTTLLDDGVFHAGRQIGLVSSRQSRNNVTKVIVKIEEAHRDLITDSTAFYVTTGRLTLGTLGDFGQSVSTTTPLCGFGSTGAYRWYRFRNILGNTKVAVANRGRMLMQRFNAGAQ